MKTEIKSPQYLSLIWNTVEWFSHTVLGNNGKHNNMLKLIVTSLF